MAKSTPNKESLKFLKQISEKFISNLKGELLSNDKIASQGLVNSLEFKLADGIETIRLDYMFNSYAKFVISGQKPHWIPIKPLKDWARAKGQSDSLAFATQKKISREGVKEFPFVENIMKAMSLEESIIQGLASAVKIDFEDKIKEALEEYMQNKKAA